MSSNSLYPNRQSGVVCAPQPRAVEIGARTLRAGGNAVDAAVSVALTQSLLDPQMCGLGGYALLSLFWAKGQQRVGIDAPAVAGSKVTADMWEDRVIGPNPDGWGYFLEGKVNDTGYTSICTPGTVKMLSAMLERWGTYSWSQAAAGAVEIAEVGFTVDDYTAARWKRPSSYPEVNSLLQTIQSNDEAKRLYLHEDGSAYDLGETLRNPDYAETLRHLSEYGTEDFYRGRLAQRLTSDLEKHGSYVTAEDFRDYSLRADETVTGTYRGYEVQSAPPPHGGPTLIAILNILEGFDLAAMGHNSAEYIYTLGMAMKAAFADRNPTMADPLFEEVPLDWMISKERAEEWRAVIQRGDAIEVGSSNLESPHTTHVTVVDQAGNCVALTHSLGASSGVITPGVGQMYNNSMINFHPISGHPNSIAPRKSRTTGMAPTILYKDGKPVFVLGAPGATRIITSVVQVILNQIDFGMDVLHAVHAPRIDCQLGAIRCQQRIPNYVLDEVRRRHPAIHIPFSHGGFGLVHAVTIDPESGARTGAADPGAAGMALVV